MPEADHIVSTGWYHFAFRETTEERIPVSTLNADALVEERRSAVCPSRSRMSAHRATELSSPAERKPALSEVEGTSASVSAAPASRDRHCRQQYCGRAALQRRVARSKRIGLQPLWHISRKTIISPPLLRLRKILHREKLPAPLDNPNSNRIHIRVQNIRPMIRRPEKLCLNRLNSGP